VLAILGTEGDERPSPRPAPAFGAFLDQ